MQAGGTNDTFGAIVIASADYRLHEGIIGNHIVNVAVGTLPWTSIADHCADTSVEALSRKRVGGCRTCRHASGIGGHIVIEKGIVGSREYFTRTAVVVPPHTSNAIHRTVAALRLIVRV